MFDEDRERLAKRAGNGFYDCSLVKRGAKMGPPGVKARIKAKKKLAELPITHNQTE